MTKKIQRPTLEQAKTQFVHRFTMDYVPQWATVARSDGSYYAPHFASDREWYENTLFHGESELATKDSCYTSNRTWPLGESLTQPFSK